MRNIRLKPLYLPNDDILVQPPSFLFPIDPNQKEISSKIILNNLDDLKTILRGRRLKSLTARKNGFENEEQEGVVKLSEFKAPKMHHKSPLTRRYTFRRTLSNITDSSPGTLVPSPKKIEEKVSILTTIQTIISREKPKAKDIDAEMGKITEGNKIYEAQLNAKIARMIEEIDMSSEQISKSKTELTIILQSRKTAEKEYEDQMAEILAKETSHHLSMHSVKGKKKHTLDVAEEREYFIVKESLRKNKRELHDKHLEKMERLMHSLETCQSILEAKQQHKRNCQKELKDLQESLVNFYCRNLKDAQDLREDGIRWAIKSLWNMKQPVPISTFPKFLDDESAHFLLVISEKDLEILFLQQRLNGFREEIKKDRLESVGKSPIELYGIVKDRIREIKKKSRAISLNSTEMLDTLDSTIIDNSFSRYDEIKTIKSKLRNEEKEKSELTVEEVKRVVELYQPDNTHGVGLMHIIKTLVGDKHREFRKLTQNKKDNK